MKDKTKPAYEYEYYDEPVCECMKCFDIHLRRDRKKIIPENNTTLLSIRVCPKCGAENYTYVGDKQFKRRVVK